MSKQCNCRSWMPSVQGHQSGAVKVWQMVYPTNLKGFQQKSTSNGIGGLNLNDKAPEYKFGEMGPLQITWPQFRLKWLLQSGEGIDYHTLIDTADGSDGNGFHMEQGDIHKDIMTWNESEVDKFSHP